MYDNGREDGVYLTPNKRWTLLEHHLGVQHDMQQVDGGDEPESIDERTSRSDDHDQPIIKQLKLANRTEHERTQPPPSQLNIYLKIP